MYTHTPRRLAGFRRVGIAFATFTLLNLAVFSMISLWPPTDTDPGLLGWLWLSANRPWGIITSNFVQAELPHLAGNLQGFTLATGFFVIVCLVLKVEDRRRWSRVFLWLVFLSGIVGSAIEYPVLVINGDLSWGSSGIVYGALGVLLAACLRSLPAQMRALAKEHRRWRRKRRKWGLFRFDRKSLHTFPNLMSLAILISFLFLIFTDPWDFLSAGPGVDVLAHGLGFLLGLMPAMVLFRSTFL
jgi:membrane associated rhomboid family serine protease